MYSYLFCCRNANPLSKALIFVAPSH